MARPTTSATDLVKLMNLATVPIYVLDDSRRIRFANQCLLDWVKMPGEEVVGQVCEYHSDTTPSSRLSLAAGLCPPPEVFAGQAQRAMIACQHADGKLVRRWADFVPLSTDEIECPGVLVQVGGADVCGEVAVASSESHPTELHELVREFRLAEKGRFNLGQLVGNSPLITRVRSQVRLAAQAVAHVLIVGPPGSGREHVARTIYQAEQFRFERQILLPIDCQVVDGEILQTTLSAFRQRASELGEHGQATLLLLDVERLSTDSQYVLREHVKVPGLTWRLMATAHDVNLQAEENDADDFDESLRCLLSTLVIHLPPLVERLEDVSALAQLFLEQRNAEGAKQLGGFSQDTLDLLRSYTWPNNVDELTSVVSESHDRAKGTLVEKNDLPRRVSFAADAAAVPQRVVEEVELDQFLSEVEQELMERAMKLAKGNKAAAARSLGISRQRLLRRLQYFGLE
ncbi:MAG: sigma 54-interacting transcriptional regulator [Pirellulaceae bacterium]|nr:sigma 54-interacting transcriptional regulator [Pirellulaceae bacterium]